MIEVATVELLCEKISDSTRSSLLPRGARRIHRTKGFHPSPAQFSGILTVKVSISRLDYIIKVQEKKNVRTEDIRLKNGKFLISFAVTDRLPVGRKKRVLNAVIHLPFLRVAGSTECCA